MKILMKQQIIRNSRWKQLTKNENVVDSFRAPIYRFQNAILLVWLIRFLQQLDNCTLYSLFVACLQRTERECNKIQNTVLDR